MKGVRITGIVVVLIAAFAVAGWSAEGISSGSHQSFMIPMVQCTDIAWAGVVTPEQAGDLRSSEFVASMESVVSGNSNYSPRFVPPEWKDAVTSWKEQRNRRSVLPSAELTGDRLMAARAGICPSSTLIFRAFLDFRAKEGRADLKPVYPHVVREASLELVRRFERFAQRARQVEASILDAERMGARVCSPTELSIAWAELDVAGRQAAENGFDIGKTEAVFAHAERAAENLLVMRQVASNQKIACYSR